MGEKVQRPAGVRGWSHPKCWHCGLRKPVQPAHLRVIRAKDPGCSKRVENRITNHSAHCLWGSFKQIKFQRKTAARAQNQRKEIRCSDELLSSTIAWRPSGRNVLTCGTVCVRDGCPVAWTVWGEQGQQPNFPALLSNFPHWSPKSTTQWKFPTVYLAQGVLGGHFPLVVRQPRKWAAEMEEVSSISNTLISTASRWLAFFWRFCRWLGSII